MKNIFKTQKQDKNKKQSKKLPVMVWIVFGVLCMGVLAIATTISDYSIVSEGVINITTIGDTAINIRPNANESASARILFWDSPTDTDSIHRIGQINVHGQDTSVKTNEMAFYITDGTGTMQNMFKLVAQDNYTGNEYLILTGAQGIARSSAGLINIGSGVLGSGVSDTRIKGVLQLDKSIDGAGVDFINITDEQLYLNGDKVNADTLISFWNSADSEFDEIRFDKTGFLGDGDAGFKITDSVWINDTLTLQANETGKTCDTGNKGAIYYDGGTNKHRGCNGTNWNDFY